MITYRNKIDYLITRSQSIWESLIFCSHKNTLTKWKNRNANSLNLPEAVLLIGRNPWGIHAYNTWNRENEYHWRNEVKKLNHWASFWPLLFNEYSKHGIMSDAAYALNPTSSSDSSTWHTHSPQGRRHNSLK